MFDPPLIPRGGMEGIGKPPEKGVDLLSPIAAKFSIKLYI
jgi:hypothetical protein